MKIAAEYVTQIDAVVRVNDAGRPLIRDIRQMFGNPRVSPVAVKAFPCI